jgi:hypothetical protein
VLTAATERGCSACSEAAHAKDGEYTNERDPRNAAPECECCEIFKDVSLVKESWRVCGKPKGDAVGEYGGYPRVVRGSAFEVGEEFGGFDDRIG